MLVLLLSGPVAVGKTLIADILSTRYGMARIRTGAHLVALARQRGCVIDRLSLQTIGDELDDATNYEWVLRDVAGPAIAKAHAKGAWLLDSVRKSQQVGHLRARYGESVVHVHLDATEDVLRERYERRRDTGGDYTDDVPYEIAIRHPNEIVSRKLIEIADAAIDVSTLTAVEAAREVVVQCQRLGGPECVKSS